MDKNTRYRKARVRIRRGPEWNVRPAAEAMDGRVIGVEYGWQIKAHNRLQYAGEIAWIIDRDDDDGYIGWVASGDLEFCPLTPPAE
jgi:hypothetical protein